MWKALARDVVCFASAVILVGVAAAALLLALALWLAPPSEAARIWLVAPLAALAATGMASLSVLLYVPLRGRTRRGGPVTPPYWRETLALPALLGVALGLGSQLVASLAGQTWGAGLAFLAGLAETVLLALAAWLVVLVQRVSTRPARTLALAAVALVGVWLGGRLALDAWGNRIFAVYAAGARAEIDVERARIAADRAPVLFGEPLDDNAAERYRVLTQKVTERLKPTKAPSLLAAAMKDGVGQPRSAEVAQLIELCRPELTELREAVRCVRCDWGVRWELGPAAPIPSLIGARQAAQLLILDGLQHAASGDVVGAIERDLEVVRMGSDYEGAGGLIGALIGVAVETIGTNALLDLALAEGPPSGLPWGAIQSKLERLEPHLASVSVGYRYERFFGVGWPPFAGDTASLALFDLPRFLDVLVPGRLVVADAIRSINEALRGAELANTQADPREARRLSGAAMQRALASRNIIVHIALPSLGRARDSQDRLTARFRLLRAVAEIEQVREKEGHYPADAAALGLPVDPFAYPSPLRYASLGEGRAYKVWSVGANGQDDGGETQGQADEVFERATGSAIRADSARPRRDGPRPHTR